MIITDTFDGKNLGKVFLLLISGSIVSGCSLFPERTANEVIPISEVLNELKRELAEYEVYSKELKMKGEGALACSSDGKNRHRIVKMTPLEAKLTLKTVSDTSKSGEAKLGVIPLGTATLSGSASVSASSTTTQSIELVLLPVSSSKQRPMATKPTNSLGLAHALLSVQNELLKTNPSEPCLLPKSLTVTIIFGVTRKVSGGVGIELVVASLGSKFSNSREDTQSLVLKMDLEGSTAAFQ